MKRDSERRELLRALLRDPEDVTASMFDVARSRWEGLRRFDDSDVLRALRIHFYNSASGSEDGRVALYWRHAMLPILRGLHATERSDG